MKKILALVTVLALVAALVVPMAVSAAVGNTATATNYVSGDVVAPSIGITAPSVIAFGMFKLGSNVMASSPNGGLNITLNSANSVTWQVTAEDVSTNNGLLNNGSSSLTEELMIGKNTSSLWYNANGAGGVLTYTGGYNGSWTGDSLSFAAGQTVSASDPVGNGFWTTITFTATMTSEN
jgi:hypothetical protein